MLVQPPAAYYSTLPVTDLSEQLKKLAVAKYRMCDVYKT